MSNRIGAIYDDAVRNVRRLLISHCGLGLIAALAYWLRPGTVTIPVRYSVPRFADVMPIVGTLLAWIPYAISFVVARALMESRRPAATFSFLAIASLITAISAGLYLNAFLRLNTPIPPAFIAGSVALGLIATAYVCSWLWPPRPSE